MNAEDVLIILPVSNTVLFPGVVLPIAIAGNAALAAAQEAVRTQRRVGLLLQTDPGAEAPGAEGPDAVAPGTENLHRVGTGLEHNWNRCGRRFGCQCDCRAAAGCDHRDRAADQLGGERRQSVQLIFCPAIFDRDISAFDIAGVGQTLAKAVHLQFVISH